MAKAKLAITIDEQTLADLDNLVRLHIFPNRSRAIEQAVIEKLTRLNHGRLARACAQLDPLQEKGFAEEGMQVEVDQWPAY